MAEIQHHHEMKHSLTADTDNLDGARATYVIEYDHSHDGGEKAHSHEHNSTIEPKSVEPPKQDKPWWEL